jgi:circadian clock protein KaiC
VEEIEVERLATGIEELDLVLGGGLPSGSLVMLAGGPGTGKTILAQQICFANATSQRKAICYTTLSEPHAKLVRHLEPFDFYEQGALGTRIEFIALEGLLVEGRTSGNGLDPLVAEVVRKCFESRPSVVVIDSARALRDFLDDRPLRRAIHELAARVAHTGAVLLLVGEYTPSELQSSPESALADGILELAYEPHEPVDRRWLRVVKMRGANHLGGKHTFRIDHRGIDVFPRLEAIEPSEVARAEEGRISSGIPELDEMMGGGIPLADATAILGPSGCGKTVIALRFTVEGLHDGERCLYVSFQESADQLVRKAASFGWDLASPLGSGQLLIHHVPHGQLNLDAVATVVQRELARGSVRRVAIDSLAELVLAARETDRFPAYARMLTGLIRLAGASVLVTSETSTLGPVLEPIGGLSFLFQNVVLLRYVELGAELRRALNILKMRDSDHAKGVMQFEIDEQGVKILGKLEGVTGVLGWSALRADR